MFSQCVVHGNKPRVSYIPCVSCFNVMKRLLWGGATRFMRDICLEVRVVKPVYWCGTDTAYWKRQRRSFEGGAMFLFE